MEALEKESLNELLDRLAIKNWDILLIGDGSGSTWKREAGWACVSIERETMERLIHIGSMNHGTVNIAEIMAYIQPLEWLSSREIERREKHDAPVRAFQVHIITDSDYCRLTGSSTSRTMRKNAGLWAMMDIYARHGFVLHWHHVRGHTDGEGCALNKYADQLSKLARRIYKDQTDTLVSAIKETRSVYEINA